MARDYNGSTQYTSATSSASLSQPSTAVTICCWARAHDPNTAGNDGAMVAGKLVDASGNPSYGIRATVAGVQRYYGFLSIGAGAQTANTASTYIDTWVFLALRWTSGEQITLRVYNEAGTLLETVTTAGTVSGTITHNGGQFRVAADAFGFWWGSAERVVVWDRKLSDVEVDAQRTNGNAVTDAVLDWQLTDAGATEADVSGDGNTGTHNSSPTVVSGPSGVVTSGVVLAWFRA